ncbi:MAG: hypothetical protein AB9897_03025 [Anaerolineaceae bacterium]
MVHIKTLLLVCICCMVVTACGLSGSSNHNDQNGNNVNSQNTEDSLNVLPTTNSLPDVAPNTIDSPDNPVGDLEVYNIEYDEGDSFIFGDGSVEDYFASPGMKMVKFQIALANTSKSEWKNVKIVFNSITSKEGYEYDRDYSGKCSQGLSQYTCCFKNSCNDSFGNDPVVDSLAPGMQTLTEEVIWEVSEASSDYTLNLTIKANGGSKDTSILLSKNNLKEFKTPFTGNQSWQDYKNSGITNVIFLGMNESTTFKFGSFTPIDFFDNEDNYDGIWIFKYYITNSNPAFQENIDVVRGYFFDGTMGYVSYFEDPWVEVGPSQTITLESLFSRSGNAYEFFNSAYEFPEDLSSTIKPLCVAITSIEWRDHDGNKNKQLMNVVACVE